MKANHFEHFGGMLTILVLSACSFLPQQAPEPTPTRALPSRTATPAPASPTPTHTPLPAPKGPCDNVLYPLLPGSEWVYQSSGSQGETQMVLQVIDVSENLASIRMIDTQADITSEDTVQCRQGAVVNLPMIYISLLLSDYVDGVINTYQESGITAPSLETLSAQEWQYSWTVEKLVEQPVKIAVPDLGSGFILRSNIIKFTSETTGARESITVPAGNFPQAILVTTELRSPVSIGSTSASFAVRYREWYQPFVGLLKIQSTAASLDYTGVPIPIPLDKSLELSAYNLGTQ